MLIIKLGTPQKVWSDFEFIPQICGIFFQSNDFFPQICGLYWNVIKQITLIKQIKE